MKEPGIIKMAYPCNGVAIFLLWALVFSFPTPSFSGNQEAAETRLDYASARESIQKFEDVINGIVSSNFSSSPFAVVQKAKGAYLQGYGISFTFLINIHRAVINTPFGKVHSGPVVSSELKARRIEELKEKLLQTLQDSGDSFQQLRKDEHVTIVVFVEDRNFPGEPNANRTIVMSALKKDLDELGHRNDRSKEFKQRMKIVEY